jgi:hypothetical protein
MTASTHTSNVRQNHRYDEISFVNTKNSSSILGSFVPDTYYMYLVLYSSYVVVNGATAGWKFASVQTLFPPYVLDMWPF